MARIQIDRALLDAHLLGAALGNPKTWKAWLVTLKAAFGLGLNPEEPRIFASIAGERAPPTSRVRELWGIVARRGGKSRMAAAISLYLAAFVKHKLAPGEVGMVLVLAASQAQASTVYNYIKGFFEASPTLRKEILNSNRHEIVLRNGIVIAVHANSFRTVRGRTLVAAVFDESAFWRSEESATPDTEVYTAVLPALANCNGMLIGISTPYRKVGLLYQKYRDWYGVTNNEVLVVKGTNKQFNPSLSDNIIDTMRAADPTAAASEWDVEFRTDLSGLFDDELIDRAIMYDRPLELPPLPSYHWYQAYTDPGGGRQDSYTLAIGHKEGENFIIDLVRGTQGKV
jgi:hypothetical protein